MDASAGITTPTGPCGARSGSNARRAVDAVAPARQMVRCLWHGASCTFGTISDGPGLMARRAAALQPSRPLETTQDDCAGLWAMADQGQVALATQGLIRLLTARPDDRAALLAAYLLALPQDVPADAAAGTVLSASVAQLVTLVRAQDRQIAALLDLLDE